MTLGSEGKVPYGDTTSSFCIAGFHERSHSLTLETEAKLPLSFKGVSTCTEILWRN